MTTAGSRASRFQATRRSRRAASADGLLARTARGSLSERADQHSRCGKRRPDRSRRSRSPGPTSAEWRSSTSRSSHRQGFVGVFGLTVESGDRFPTGVSTGPRHVRFRPSALDNVVTVGVDVASRNVGQGVEQHGRYGCGAGSDNRERRPSRETKSGGGGLILAVVYVTALFFIWASRHQPHRSAREEHEDQSSR